MALVDLNKPGEKEEAHLGRCTRLCSHRLPLVDVLRLRQQQFFSGDCATAGHSNAAARRRAEQHRITAVSTVNGVDVSVLRPIDFQHSSYDAPEAKRNIFAFWVPPPKPVPAQKIETPSPTPPPPVLLASLSPANAYARSPEFKLDVAGDKFTPETRIFVDGRELPTKYTSPQQLSATIPAAFISTPGARKSWCARLTIVFTGTLPL